MEFSTLSVLISLFFLLLLFHNLITRKAITNLPPGPRPWPLVGNFVHLVRLLGRGRWWAISSTSSASSGPPNPVPLHAALAALSKAHGPLAHLRLGSQSLVVASSCSTAAAVLKTHDRLLSARHIPATYRVPNYIDHSLIWSCECDDKWKSLRTLCRSRLFSISSLASGELTRSTKAKDMVDFLRQKEGTSVDIAEVVFRTVFDMFGNTVFSRDLMGLVGEVKSGWNLKEDMESALEIGQKLNLEDYFPGLVGKWDLQGLRREASESIHRMYNFYEEIMKERLEGERKEDFLDAMVDAGLQGFPLLSLILDIFTAGTDTTTTSIEWTMAELVRNQPILQTLRQELQTTNQQQALKESDVLHLPYLQACIKESLRLHPPAPLLLPHRAASSCQVMGHNIPEGAVIMVNVWAMGRDPTTWEEPLVFKPERFVGKEGGLDVMAFGMGRRMCPGMTLANRIASLVVASLVVGFEWSAPGGAEVNEISMEEKPGLVLEREEPLLLVPKSISLSS